MNYLELAKKYPGKKFGDIMIIRDFKYLHTGVAAQEDEIKDLGWQFRLDHSCDEWVIGELKDAKKFLEDLKQAIQFIENNN